VNSSGGSLPTVTRLFTTPIKGFSLSQPASVTLGPTGAEGDRDFFIVDSDQQLLSITRTGAFAGWRAQFDRESGVLTLVSSDGLVLEDTVTEDRETTINFWESQDVSGHILSGPWSDWLSDIAGQPVDLIRATQPGGANDVASVTVVSEESIAELARATNTEPIDIRRFRMLINISGVEPHQEETWRPATVRIGSAVLKMRGPVPRCNATTRNPDTGIKDLKTLRLIAESRGMQPDEFGEDGLNLGAYADVIEPGVVSVGDHVEFV
jgi:uncharacterized protein